MAGAEDGRGPQLHRPRLQSDSSAQHSTPPCGSVDNAVIAQALEYFNLRLESKI